MGIHIHRHLKTYVTSSTDLVANAELVVRRARHGAEGHHRKALDVVGLAPRAVAARDDGVIHRDLTGANERENIHPERGRQAARRGGLVPGRVQGKKRGAGSQCGGGGDGAGEGAGNAGWEFGMSERNSASDGMSRSLRSVQEHGARSHATWL